MQPHKIHLEIWCASVYVLSYMSEQAEWEVYTMVYHILYSPPSLLSSINK